jgi:hypothetical protein
MAAVWSVVVACYSLSFYSKYELGNVDGSTPMDVAYWETKA